MLQKKIKSNCLVVLLGFSIMMLLVSTGCKKPDLTQEEMTVTDTIVPKKTASRTIPAVAPVTFPADLLTAFPAASWMSKIGNNVRLSHLSIPGTRWSSQYQSSASGQYQARSISQQLNMGVRYLHVKCGQTPALSVIMNNNTSIPFQGFVDTLKTFLNQNPLEAVVVMLEQDDNLPYPDIWAGHIRSTVDENAAYFYKWPNYFNPESPSVGDWPKLEAVRKRIILVSHSNLLKNTYVARVLNNSQINLGWTSNGSSMVTASVLHQFSQTTGASKVNAADNLMQKADTLASTVHSLFLNETGIDQSSSASVLSDANYVNPKIDDVLEGEYNQNYNYGRFGIVAMNYLSDYTSKLIYLTNFNRYTKLFKATVLGSSAFPYYSDFSIQGYPLSQLYGHYTEVPNSTPTPGTYVFPTSVWNHFSGTDWMSKIPDGTLISMVNIPGTHDAGSNTGSVPYGKCQDWAITQQLDYGVRFLDLRLKYTNEQEGLWMTTALRVHHGDEIYNYHWSTVLTDLTAFLAAHPSETIILKTQISSNEGWGDEAALLFKERIWTQNKENYFWTGSAATTDWPRMRDLRGKILLLQADRGVNYGSINWSHPDKTTGANATASIFNTSDSVLGYAQDVYEGPGIISDQYHNKWEYIRYTAQLAQYEATTMDVYNRLWLNYTSYVGVNPRDAANDLNPRLKQFLDNEFSGPFDIPRRSGIYVCDFMDNKMASGIYLTNFSRTQIMNSF